MKLKKYFHSIDPVTYRITLREVHGIPILNLLLGRSTVFVTYARDHNYAWRNVDTGWEADTDTSMWLHDIASRQRYLCSKQSDQDREAIRKRLKEALTQSNP